MPRIKRSGGTNGSPLSAIAWIRSRKLPAKADGSRIAPDSMKMPLMWKGSSPRSASLPVSPSAKKRLTRSAQGHAIQKHNAGGAQNTRTGRHRRLKAVAWRRTHRAGAGENNRRDAPQKNLQRPTALIPQMLSDKRYQPANTALEAAVLPARREFTQQRRRRKMASKCLSRKRAPMQKVRKGGRYDPVL